MLKEHKKMYKAGKSWVTAMVTIAAVALFTNVTTSVHADTVVNNTNNAAITEKVEDAQSYTEAAQQSTTANTDSNQNTANTNANSNTSTDSSSNAQSQVASNGNQWAHFNGGWSYTDNQGNWVYNQWQRINNNWYYFNNGGYAQTGWYRSGAGNWYYFDNNNAWADTGWQYINNNWYYFDKDNAWALTGWQKLNNKWYYFDYNNAWALRGWQHINNSWYYFDNNNVWALTGWFRSGAGNWYYFDNNNAWALTGLHEINNKWYDFDYNNAWALKGWQHINNNWYYFDNINDWALTGWQKINNSWYYFDNSTARALTGWQKINNKWYYLDPVNAWMLTGSHNINGKSEYFFPSGAWDEQGIVKTAQDGVNRAQDTVNAKQNDVNAANREVQNAQNDVNNAQNSVNQAQQQLNNLLNAQSAGNYDVNKDYAITGPNKIVLSNDMVSVLKDWLAGKITNDQLTQDPRFYQSCQKFYNEINTRYGDKLAGLPFIANDADRSKNVSWSEGMKEANRYFLALLNPIRIQLGLTPLSTNDNVQNLAAYYGKTESNKFDNAYDDNIDPVSFEWYKQNGVAQDNGFVLDSGFGDGGFPLNDILGGEFYTVYSDEMKKAGLQYPVSYVNIPNGMINISNLHQYLYNYIVDSFLPYMSRELNSGKMIGNVNFDILQTMLNKNVLSPDYGPTVNGQSKLHVGIYIDHDGGPTLYYIFTRDNTQSLTTDPAKINQARQAISQAQSKLTQAQAQLVQAQQVQSQAQSKLDQAKAQLTNAQKALSDAKSGQTDYASLQKNLADAKLALV